MPERTHEAVEDDVDHAEPALVIGVLLLEVGEIGRHRVQSHRQQTRRARATRAGLDTRSADASSTIATTDRARSRRRRPSRAGSSSSDISPRHAPGSRHGRDRDAGLLDPERALDEYVQRRNRCAVDDECVVDGQHATRAILSECEHLLHVRSVADEHVRSGAERSAVPGESPKGPAHSRASFLAFADRLAASWKPDRSSASTD